VNLSVILYFIKLHCITESIVTASSFLFIPFPLPLKGTPNLQSGIKNQRNQQTIPVIRFHYKKIQLTF